MVFYGQYRIPHRKCIELRLLTGVNLPELPRSLLRLLLDLPLKLFIRVVREVMTPATILWDSSWRETAAIVGCGSRPSTWSKRFTSTLTTALLGSVYFFTQFLPHILPPRVILEPKVLRLERDGAVDLGPRCIFQDNWDSVLAEVP